MTRKASGAPSGRIKAEASHLGDSTEPVHQRAAIFRRWDEDVETFQRQRQQHNQSEGDEQGEALAAPRA